jgi:NTE family protein
MGDRIAVVLSGAAARGAFQAGALAVLVPQIEAQGHRVRIFLGTSAGSINAALWGANLHLGADACGTVVADTWRTMDRPDVFAHPAATIALSRTPQFLMSLSGHGGAPSALLDTAPLRRTAQRVLDAERLARNVADGVVEAIGVTATRMPPRTLTAADDPDALTDADVASLVGDEMQLSPAFARSVVFADSATLPLDKIADPSRAVDVAKGPITVDQVLASAAIPLGFPPVLIDAPDVARGWYIDGGVRLNTPLRPALALGADRLVVVAGMSTEFGQQLPPAPLDDPIPTMADAAAQLMHATMADRMAEDLRTLRSLNRVVEQAADAGTSLTKRDGAAMRAIPLMTVSPAPGALGALAEDVLVQQTRSLSGKVRESDSLLLDRLLRGMGDGPGRRELLSYVFFDSEYFTEQLELGAAAARAALARGWEL